MKFQRRNQNRKRRGFTLMELLLVMAILVIMASMVGFAFLNMREGALQDATRSQISVLKTACKKYKMDNNRFPQQLSDLLAQPANADPAKWRGPYLDLDNINPAKGIVDSWDQQYTYQANEQTNRVSITSMGPDGQSGGEDDIPSPNETMK